MRNFRRAERERAISRGLDFLYRTACDADAFELYGHDLLFCFHGLSSTSVDEALRARARKMGRERARHWRRKHGSVPRDVDANGVVHLVFGSYAADRLGVRDSALKPRIRRAAARFTAEDYFCFDPMIEAPPVDVPAECDCGAENLRGLVRCRWCKKRLSMLGRYGAWIDALIRTYIGERYGVTLGAPFREAIKWLPAMRPYPAIETGADNTDFYWSVYAVTHIVYTLNDYSAYRLSPRWLPVELEFLKANLDVAIRDEDPETLGEILESLKAFGLSVNHKLMRRGVEFILSQQNEDGSWGEVESEDIYHRYHSTYKAIDGLRDIAWRGERLCFPKLKPMLREWSKRPA